MFQRDRDCVKDLFTKKFLYQRGIKIKTKTADGCTVTAETASTDSAVKNLKSVSSLTGKYEDKAWGSVEAFLDTNTDYKVVAKITKLLKGLTAKAKTETKKDIQFQGDLDYTQSNFTGFGTILASADKAVGKKLTVGAFVTHEGMSVGAQADFSLNGAAGSSALTDYGLGAQYCHKDFTASVQSEKKLDVLKGSCTHIYSSSTLLAAQADVNLAKGVDASITVGGQHTLDSDNTLLAKFQLKQGAGVVSGVWERVLNRNVKASFAVEFDATHFNIANPKLGVGLQLGDLSD